MLQIEQSQEWVESWWLPDARGGKKGKCLSDALVAVDAACIDEKFLVSLDFSVAFDALHPKLVAACFKHTGMPCGVANTMASVWCEQCRLVTYAGHVNPTFQHVAAPMPQGDTWSTLRHDSCGVGPRAGHQA